MPLLHLIILALVQGVTEFLPISSSGHLVLLPKAAGWADQGLTMDVAVHVGTLGAVILYFWRDLWSMTSSVMQVFKGRRAPRFKDPDGPGTELVGLLFVATIPVIIAGYLINDYAGDALRSLTVVAWATLGFGIVLYLTDKLGMTLRRLEHLGFGDAIIIGLAQTLALIPGTSRSGITMSAARMVGMERTDAARFSMLLSIPAILGAGVLKGVELYQSGDAALTAAVVMAAGLSFIAALITIFVLMAWLRRATFTPFVVYRVLLGGALLAIAYGWV